MRDLVINEILQLAQEHALESVKFYVTIKMTREELNLCPDEDLLELLGYLWTYDPEEE